MYTGVLASVFLVGMRACVEGSVRGAIGSGGSGEGTGVAGRMAMEGARGMGTIGGH